MGELKNKRDELQKFTAEEKMLFRPGYNGKDGEDFYLLLKTLKADYHINV